MSLLQFRCMLVFLLVNVFSLFLADETHNIEKRQIGVLARTGALPQGKRSVEVLARNGELPHLGGKKDANEETQDLLIEELQRAESFSKLRAQALAEKLLEEREPERFVNDKRSVAALARNGELPQKRLSEYLSRSGYLVRPPQETVQQPVDPFDPDDFLADGQSKIPDYSDERSFRTILSSSKRSLGSPRNFLAESGINLYDKKNVASLARDGGFTSLKHPMLKDRKVEDIYDLIDFHDNDKKNIDPSKREVLGKCWDKTVLLDKGNNRLRKREQFTGDSEYQEFSPDYPGEGYPVEKRFLGRIPQLGRIHQKVQSPSSRRRPHLRPNWL